MILKINNLNVKINNKQIITNLNLHIKSNEFHIIMGSNGVGKSSLFKTLVGHLDYQISNGSISFKNKNLILMKPEIRAKEGLFLAFQSPIEIYGLKTYDFLYFIFNEKQKYLKLNVVNHLEFINILYPILHFLQIKDDCLYRDLNYNFSGGEKKKNELLQMFLLKPNLILLDEIDSGLDFNALKLIKDIIQKMQILQSSIILITHSPFLVSNLKPNYIHTMKEGTIIHTETNVLNFMNNPEYNFNSK